MKVYIGDGIYMDNENCYRGQYKLYLTFDGEKSSNVIFVLKKHIENMLAAIESDELSRDTPKSTF